jgi:hypothetical protein
MLFLGQKLRNKTTGEDAYFLGMVSKIISASPKWVSSEYNVEEKEGNLIKENGKYFITEKLQEEYKVIHKEDGTIDTGKFIFGGGGFFGVLKKEFADTIK